MTRLVAVISVVPLLGGCGQPTSSASNSPTASEPAGGAGAGGAGGELVVEVAATEGHSVTGTVKFVPEGDGVRVVVGLAGLTPGKHGIHIHETGDCSAPDGSSAGGHFNPAGTEHGGPGASAHHMGDLGNIVADANGEASLDQVFPFLSLSGPDSIAGRAVVVHGGADDLTSQPSGDAGPRVGCGVIPANTL